MRELVHSGTKSLQLNIGKVLLVVINGECVWLILLFQRAPAEYESKKLWDDSYNSDCPETGCRSLSVENCDGFVAGSGRPHFFSEHLIVTQSE